MASTKLLLTGFEPFDRQPINVSEKVVNHFAKCGVDGFELETAVLPVNWLTAPDQLLRLFFKHQPDAVVSLGQAGGRPTLSLERIAVNLLDFITPDNGGNLETDRWIQGEGDLAYFTTLPTRRMLKAIQDAGIPVNLSMSAGTFICNQVMYEMLHHVKTFNLKTKAGFIHLPFLPEQAAGRLPPAPSMSLETQCEGIRLGLEAIFVE